MSETTEVQTTETTAPEGGLETQVQPVKEVERPWKAKPEPEAQHVPYSRFHEVYQRGKTAETRAEAAEARLRELAAREAKFAEVKGPEDIKASDYSDPEEFLKARDKALASKLLSDFETKAAERTRNQIVAKQNEELATTYQRNLNESFTRNPEIKEASEFLDRILDSGVKIHPAVAQELMMDDNVGELIFDITTNEALLNEMFRSNPADFIRKMHKMSARIDREARYAKKEEGEPIQALERTKQDIAAAIPTQLKGASAPVKKDPSKMSQAEYRKWREAGK
jgi:hypothetical protein